MWRSVSTRSAGFVIVLAAIWGGIIPFVGPYFHFTLGPDHTWTWTAARFYLDVLPAIAAFVGGLLLIRAGPWATGRLGALLALAGGIWFAIGPNLSALWRTGGAEGTAVGTPRAQMMERLGLHTGVGVLITALAAFALPGLLAAYRARRDQAMVATATPAGAAAPVPAGVAAPAGAAAAFAPGVAAPANGPATPAPAGARPTPTTGPVPAGSRPITGTRRNGAEAPRERVGA